MPQKFLASLLIAAFLFTAAPAFALKGESHREAGLEEVLTQALTSPDKAIQRFAQLLTIAPTRVSSAGLEEDVGALLERWFQNMKSVPPSPSESNELASQLELKGAEVLRLLSEWARSGKLKAEEGPATQVLLFRIMLGHKHDPSLLEQVVNVAEVVPKGTNHELFVKVAQGFLESRMKRDEAVQEGKRIEGLSDRQIADELLAANRLKPHARYTLIQTFPFQRMKEERVRVWTFLKGWKQYKNLSSFSKRQMRQEATTHMLAAGESEGLKDVDDFLRKRSRHRMQIDRPKEQIRWLSPLMDISQVARYLKAIHLQEDLEDPQGTRGQWSYAFQWMKQKELFHIERYLITVPSAAGLEEGGNSAVMEVGQAIRELSELREARVAGTGYLFLDGATLAAALTLSAEGVENSEPLPVAAVVNPAEYHTLMAIAEVSGLEEDQIRRWAERYLFRYDSLLTKESAIESARGVLALRLTSARVAILDTLPQVIGEFGRAIDTILRSFGVNLDYKKLQTFTNALYQAAQA